MPRRPAAAGRRLVAPALLCLLAGPVAAQAALFPTVGDLVVLPAPTPETGTELFVVDRARGEARLVADLVPGPAGSTPDLLTAFDGRVYFRAETPATGAEVFVFDPATDAVALAADLVPGPTGSDPTALAVRDGVLIVTGTGPDGAPQTWPLASAVAATEEAALATALGPIAPNPTAGGATVRWTLATAGEARVAVVDLLGREVAVLAAGPLAAGPHEATLPASLAPGAYLVRLTAGPATAAARVTVAR